MAAESKTESHSIREVMTEETAVMEGLTMTDVRGTDRALTETETVENRISEKIIAETESLTATDVRGTDRALAETETAENPEMADSARMTETVAQVLTAAKQSRTEKPKNKEIVTVKIAKRTIRHMIKQRN